MDRGLDLDAPILLQAGDELIAPQPLTLVCSSQRVLVATPFVANLVLGHASADEVLRYRVGSQLGQASVVIGSPNPVRIAKDVQTVILGRLQRLREIIENGPHFRA